MNVPRLLLIVLALAFVASQGVSWADCCCGSFCEHKNTCTGCGPEDNCRGGAEKPACCDQEESQPQKTCSHLEPSSEIDSVDVDGTAVPLIVESFTAVDLVPPATAPSTLVRVDTGPPRPLPLVLRI